MLPSLFPRTLLTSVSHHGFLATRVLVGCNSVGHVKSILVAIGTNNLGAGMDAQGTVGGVKAVVQVMTRIRTGDLTFEHVRTHTCTKYICVGDAQRVPPDGHVPGVRGRPSFFWRGFINCGVYMHASPV